MEVEVNGIKYTSIYFPFFRKEKHEDYSLYGLRYPSGYIEEFVVFENANYKEELRKHLAFVVKEYMLEDDDMLTPRAMRLKEDVRKLFGQ